MEVVVVAFATEAGVLEWSGLIVMAWAAGSLVSGVVTGTFAWKVTAARRFRVGAVLLAASVLPLVFISSPVLVTAALCLSGLAVAPTLIATIAVTQEAVPNSRLTEALGWTSMGMAGGVAVGAAALGQVVDHWGSRAGFVGIVVVGVLLIMSSLCVRSAPAPSTPARTEETEAPTAAL
jgi:MFS family permease